MVNSDKVYSWSIIQREEGVVKVGGEKVEGINVKKARGNPSLQSWEKGALSVL